MRLRTCGVRLERESREPGLYMLGHGWPSEGRKQDSGGPVLEAVWTAAVKETGQGYNGFCTGKEDLGEHNPKLIAQSYN